MKTSNREHIQLEMTGDEFMMLHYALLFLESRLPDSERRWQRCELRKKLEQQAGIEFSWEES
jgi:hypothetical protein